MADNSTSFECEIKEIKSRISASQDKVGRLVIEFRPTLEILNGLNRLHNESSTVTIAIIENPRGYDLNG